MSFCAKCEAYLASGMMSCPRCGLPAPPASAPRTIWPAKELSEQPGGPLSVVGDLLLIATQEPVEPPQRSALCAFSLADGSRRWQQPFEYALVSGLETFEVSKTSKVLVSTSSTDVLRGHGALLALSASGQELWRWSPGAQKVSAPAVAGDVVHVTADARTLYALDARAGQERARVELPESASLSAPALSGDMAYIPCRSPHLLAVRLDGKLLWRFTLKDSPDTWLDKTPVLAHQNVYAVSSQGAVVAVRASDGTQVWQVQVGPMGKPLSPLASDGEQLRFAVGARDGVHALDLADGREAWAFHTERRIEAAPVVASGVIYVTCHDRHLYALDAATGRKLWQHETARRIEVAPVLATCGEPAKPCIIVADHGGTLVALERPLGAREHEQAGHWVEAASVYADLGQHARGAELLQTHGEPFKAAELWKAVGDLERAAGQYQAAGAWLQAAEIWQALGQPLKQAQALEQHARSLQASPHSDEERAQAWHIAAQAFDNVGEAERAAACQCEIAQLRRLPCIRVQVHTPDVMRLNESHALTFELTNVGGGVARQVLLRHTESEFAGDLKRTQHIRNVMPGQSVSEVLSLRALVAGTVSLQVSVDYTDEAGHTYETRHRLRVHVRRPAKDEDGTGLTDLQVRIFARETKGYPVELTLDGEQVFERGYLSDDILPWHSESTPAQAGRRLFERLLADMNLREAWGKVRGQSPRSRVRLWIDVGAPELHAVPWESLREGDLVLSASADTPFSRYLPIAKPWGSPVSERPSECSSPFPIRAIWRTGTTCRPPMWNWSDRRSRPRLPPWGATS